MLDAQMKSVLSLLERQDESLQVAGYAPTIVQFWDGLDALAARSDLVAIRGAAAVKRSAPASYATAKDYREFAEEVTTNVEIVSGGRHYTLAYDIHTDHRRGDGGETRSLTQLLRDGVPVVASVARTLHTTLSDDSEDYECGRDERLYLLDKHDALGVAVFDILRQPAPRKPR
jgi:hypothetical protein